MYTKEQIEIALKEFDRLGSVQATITLLGCLLPGIDGQKKV